MIDIALYRIRIGNFNMTCKLSRFMKSKKCFFKPVKQAQKSLAVATVVVSLLSMVIAIILITDISVNANSIMLTVYEYECKEYVHFKFMDRAQFSIQTTKLIYRIMQNDKFSVKVQVQDFNFLARCYNGNGVKMKGIVNIHLNIRSLKYKVHEVKNIIKEHSPTIIGLSECELLKDNVEEKSLKIPGYDILFPSSWFASGHARIVVYVKKNFQYNQITELQDSQIQSIWIQGGYRNSKSIMFGHVYREHLSGRSSADQEAYMSRVLDQWEAATLYGNSSQPNETHISGDINIDVYNDRWLEPDYKLVHLSKLLKMSCDTNNFTQLVKGITRVQYNSVSGESSMSCLDHCYTNAKHRCSEPDIISFGDSDHDAVGYIRYSKVPSSPSRTICKRSYKNFDSQAFINDIKLMNWSDVYSCVDVDLAANFLTMKINSVLDQHAPWVKIQERKHFVPWLSKQSKELIKERDLWKGKAKSLAMLGPDFQADQEAAWNMYKRFRNSLNNRKKKEEILFKSEKVQESLNSPEILWRTAKNFMGWKSPGCPTQLVVNNRLVSSAREIAQLMNCFFVEKIETICKGIPYQSLDLTKLHQFMQNKECSLEFQYATVPKICKVLKGLSNSKSTSTDGLNNFSVKLIAAYIAPPLQHVISLSLLQQKFPHSWKFAKLIPLHKKGDLLDRQNYRPVALLSPLSKVL